MSHLISSESRCVVGLFVCTLLLIGCGKSSNRTAEMTNLPVSNDNTQAKQSSSNAEIDSTHPAMITVTQFMTAMVHGETQTLRSLLTPLARSKGDQYGIPFAPTASQTATFQIGRMVEHGENGVYVYTTLIERDIMGQLESADIIWCVSKVDKEWRIAGAAVALFEGQDKTVINFEDPVATQAALIEAEQQIKRR
ncbi:MAG: hypothetical protein ACRCUY_12910 [Thermoguttaceae bacterium]